MKKKVTIILCEEIFSLLLDHEAEGKKLSIQEQMGTFRYF